MAPTAPNAASSSGASKRLSARQKVRARLAASSGPALPKTFRPSAVIADTGFLNTKRDKRLIKHSSFVSRIAKATTPAAKKKRSRPSKQLVATLESLGDALDDITADLAASGDALMDAEQAAQGKVRHRSLKSRPGALKRKERIVKAEMERFGRNLARVTAGAANEEQSLTLITQGGHDDANIEVAGTKAQQPSGTTSRWAALRGEISRTMEQNPTFLKKT